MTYSAVQIARVAYAAALELDQIGPGPGSQLTWDVQTDNIRQRVVEMVRAIQAGRAPELPAGFHEGLFYAVVRTLTSPPAIEQPADGDRILPAYRFVLGQELQEAVHVALGAASTCWEPMDATGVFQSERASQIGRELIDIVVQFAQAYPVDRTVTGSELARQAAGHIAARRVDAVSEPAVARLVHYVSEGSPVLPDGSQKYSSRCRAAVITEVRDMDPVPEHGIPYVGLCVANPTGLFFRTAVPFNAAGDSSAGSDVELCGGISRPGGTWHWPAGAGE